MHQLFSTWWSNKSTQEEADSESVFVMILDGLTVLPAFIIVVII